MRVQITTSGPVFQTDQVAVAHEFDGIGAVPARHGSVELLDEPAVVAVFVRVSGHLLLTSSHSGRIQVQVRVQVTATRDAVLQCQQRTITHLCDFKTKMTIHQLNELELNTYLAEYWRCEGSFLPNASGRRS